MSIKSLSTYQLECDNCGEPLEFDDAVMWAESEELTRYALEDGWRVSDDDQFYCPDCPIEIDNDEADA